MKSYNASLQLSELSTLQVPSISKQQRWTKLRSGIKRILKSSLAFLTDTAEIHVLQRQDRQGQTYFLACNRRTGSHFSSASEQEIRAWIEQQYYT
jgi:hypothetical protein